MAHVPNSSPNCIQDKKRDITKKSMGNEPTWQKMKAIFFSDDKLRMELKESLYLELVDPRTITHCSFKRLNVIIVRRMKLNERKHFIFLP